MKYEGWDNQETFELALYIDNHSQKMIDIASRNAHDASLNRNPTYSFSRMMIKMMQGKPPLLANVNWNEIYQHYLTKFKESEQYEYMNWQKGSTPCGVCGKPTMNHELAWTNGKYHCKSCYGKLFKKCSNCKQKRMDVKAGREYWPDELKRWDPHAHTFSDTHAMHKRYPKLIDPEELCEDCFNKKHGLVVVTLRF